MPHEIKNIKTLINTWSVNITWPQKFKIA